jgi:hypothetical protein
LLSSESALLLLLPDRPVAVGDGGLFEAQIPNCLWNKLDVWLALTELLETMRLCKNSIGQVVEILKDVASSQSLLPLMLIYVSGHR